MPETLQNVIDGVRRGVLGFTPESLGSAALATLLQRAFPNETVELQLNPPTAIQTSTTLRVQGVATSLLGRPRQAVDLLCYIHNDVLECLLLATLPQVWNFAWSYPHLPSYQDYSGGGATARDSFLYDLRFTQPVQILFSSYDFQNDRAPAAMLALLDPALDVAKVHQGLNYFLALDLQALPLLAALLAFAGSSAVTLPGHGFVEQPEHGDEQIKLVFDLPFTTSYHQLFRIGVSALVLYSSLSRYSLGATTGIMLVGGMAIGQAIAEGASQPPQNIALLWPIGSTFVIIRNNQPIPFAGFDTFQSLLPDHLPTSADFPVAPTESALAIREIALQVSLNPPSLSSITFSVGTQKGWWPALPDSLLAIEDLALRWDIAFDGPRVKAVRWFAFGALRVGGGLVEVAAIFPDFIFQGELALGEKIDLSRIFGNFLPNATLPNVEILDLAIQADLKQQLYAFEIDVASDWKIQLGEAQPGSPAIMPLKNLRIELEKSDLGVFATIGCNLAIAGVDLLLLATNAGQQASGWSFSGSTGPGQAIPIGALIADIAAKFGAVTLPGPLAGLTIQNLHVAFNTAARDFTFTAEALFSVDDVDVDLTLAIAVTRSESGYAKAFGGQLAVAGLIFDLRFVQNASSDVFVATYSHAGAPRSIRVKDLVAYVSSDLAAALPDSLTIDLKDVIFAVRKQGDVTSFLFGLDVGAAISLSQLPLVGQVFAPDQTLAVENLRLLVAARALSGDDVAAFNALLPHGVAALPTAPAPAAGAAAPALQQGLTLSAALRMGGAAVPLTLPIAADTPSAASPATSVVPAAGTALVVADNTRWFVVQRAFGPVYFARIGVQYKDGAAWFLLDATLATGGLSLSLEGLAVGSPLEHFAPVFTLRGLALAYQSDTLTIAGALLRVARADPSGQAYDEYDGAALLKTPKLTLSALGSYAYLNGYPSLFVYATLDAPIGGPAFFFVTGLAAGFGYNRALRSPAIEEVGQFPLVQAAAAGPRPSLGSSSQLMQELARMSQSMPPASGQLFFALGITFTSFKMIDSVALLTVSIGDQSAIEVLGFSTMIAPTPVAGAPAVSPIAEVRMAFKATFLPAQGFLAVSAQLVGDSYILARACRLTGGFAFYAWFAGEHAGDFVYTLGGYHPRFLPPAHYPRVPRLGINWQVNPQLSIKGQGYFALTSSALMAGGQLQATWESGNLKVWFNVGADFLVAWKPYYYDAAAYVQMRVDYTFEFWGTHHISVDVGADLRLWGPEFSGTARVKLWIISFDVAFGAAAKLPPPLDWPAFKASFLPYDKRLAGAASIADNQITACSIAAQEGLTRAIPQDGGADMWVVDPLRFVLVAQSAVPSSGARIKQDLAFDQCYFDGDGPRAMPLPFRADSPTGPLAQTRSASSRRLGLLGVGPMDVAAGRLSSSLTMSITSQGAGVEHEFSYTPILKSVPAALWGGRLTPELQGPSVVADTLAGFEIRPTNLPRTGEAERLPIAWLRAGQDEVRGAYAWAAPADGQAQGGDDAARRASIRASLAGAATTAARAAVLAALNEDVDLDLGDDVADMFFVAPQIVSY